ncbi:MAG: ATP-dependent DNA ligase [Pedobacter sp.]|nr:MAG: ATP-dependent DNA ligase [Pedobacter sp.]
MKAFANLIYTLDSTNKNTAKMEAIQDFFKTAEDADKLSFLALFTGKKPKQVIKTRDLKTWVQELLNLPEWLFLEAYASVGDLGETISLLLPAPEVYQDISLSHWMQAIKALATKTDSEKKDFVLNAWRTLPHIERFIFNKLLGGSFRVGVSAKTLINAISKQYDIEASAITHSLMGGWNPEEVNFDDLIKGAYIESNLSKPYPFCLAYPIEEIEKTLADLNNWQVEYKWDGIRGQFIKRQNEIFIWSRGEEMVNVQFPELLEELNKWEGDFVLDGEILAYAEGQVLNFSQLQKRLNRKSISKKLQAEIPVTVFLYDILEYQGKDLRSQPLSQRRTILEGLFKAQHQTIFRLSEVIAFSDLKSLAKLREGAREHQSEGLMLKHRDSMYHAGRKRGDWWKWKIDPLTIDAVLIYAQKGAGRRSGYYTDYTFAVQDGEQLVSIAKAYSGLTDKEIQEVSRFINKNAVEKFGPVRTVKPELVFEIAFEGIAFSSRHKSGVALRFPRILRWRRDKTANEIDQLAEVKKLIKP